MFGEIKEDDVWSWGEYGMRYKYLTRTCTLRAKKVSHKLLSISSNKY